MTFAYSKIKPGDTLQSYPAAFHNDVLDMLREWKATRNVMLAGTASGNPELARTIVPVKNTTGDAIDRFSILELSDFLIDPTDNEQHFKNRPAFAAVAPTSAISDLGHVPNIVVTQEPIHAGGIGLAMLSGVTPVQVQMVDPLITFVGPVDRYAMPIASDVTKLVSNPAWGVPILHVQSGTGLKWAYVQLGAQQQRPIIGKANGDGTCGASMLFSIQKGDGTSGKGDEDDTGKKVFAYIRRGIVLDGRRYILQPTGPAYRTATDLTEVLEVANPEMRFRGVVSNATDIDPDDLGFVDVYFRDSDTTYAASLIADAGSLLCLNDLDFTVAVGAVVEVVEDGPSSVGTSRWRIVYSDYECPSEEE